MPIYLIDRVKQKNDGDFPIAEANDLLGGHHQVNTIVDRNAIPTERRQELMLCSVVSDGKTYQLVGGIDNINWVDFRPILTKSDISDFDESDYVHTVGDETINGVKTFTSILKLPNSNPSEDDEAVRKGYLDLQLLWMDGGEF